MTLGLNSEDEIIEQVRAGSREAFRDLVRKHQAAVQAYLGRYIRHLDLVEDLAQESFLKAYCHLSEYRGDSPFRAWLFGIARNEALMHLRAERSRRAETAPGLLASVERWTLERIEAEESDPLSQERKLAALGLCLEGLPKHSACLIEDFYVKGLEGSRIARETGKTEVSVRVTLLRIRQALRECIEKRLAASGMTG